MLTKRSKKKGTKIKKDNMSLILFWVVISLGLTAGFFKANYNEWNNLNYSLAIVGVCIFLRWSFKSVLVTPESIGNWKILKKLWGKENDTLIVSRGFLKISSL